jgi:GGDEF domain-containing protein
LLYIDIDGFKAVNDTKGHDAGEVKIGAAVFPDHATDVDGLVKAADEAMYQAKITGKNNCVVAQT